jgi:hypothetical protein
MFESFYHIDIFPNNSRICWVAIQLRNHASGLPFGLDVAIKALGNVGYHDAASWMTSGTMLISAAYEIS